MCVVTISAAILSGKCNQILNGRDVWIDQYPAKLSDVAREYVKIDKIQG